jgi:flavin reductase (DIM6/NTAB) family NADH-FMN oxidoreductase RutF
MMNKLEIASGHPLFPMPVCLLGADVSGKPNFNAIAWFNMVDYQPDLIGISSDRGHYTNKGVRENRTFSVNVPSSDMVAVTDYCGLHSGAEVDKSGLFEVFYGELKTAPMIQECPMNVECKLSRIMEFPHAEYMVGEISRVYADERCVADNRPEIQKVNPLIYDPEHGFYWGLGERVAKAFDIGKTYKPKPK